MQLARQAYTLVEMLVALAVGAIVVMATYASYEMVNTQYQKNTDIANMHTSGRAIMQMIERDVRMAGFEYRHTTGANKGKKAFGSKITKPLDITDSGNKCCDEVKVIYDYFNEDTKTVKRIQIHYFTKQHNTPKKGNRYRLYKQVNEILPNAKTGSVDVLADFVEDLQVSNSNNVSLLYTVGGSTFNIIDIDKGEKVGMLGTHTTKRINDIQFGPNGLLYAAQGNKIYIYNTDVERRYNNKNFFYIDKSKALVGVLTSTSNSVYNFSSISFSPDGFLYALDPNAAPNGSYKSKVFVFDVFAKKQIDSFLVDYSASIDVGDDGLIYTNMGKVERTHATGRGIHVYDPATKKKINNFANGALWFNARDIIYGADKMLYAVLGPSGRVGISVVDTINPKKWDVTGLICLKKPWQNNSPRALAILNGLIYVYSHGSPRRIEVYKLFDKSKNNCNGSTKVKEFKYTSVIDKMTFKKKKSGKEALVNIKFTLRSEKEYGSNNRKYSKKEKSEQYQIGNYDFEFNDKYKHDVFATTVLVRNLTW